MVNQNSFRRLLSWYPRGWRDRNGEVALGAMLDAAEQAGRKTPTLSERWSVVVHGLGTRLDHRLALGAVIMALVAAIAIGTVFMWSATLLTTETVSWIPSVLTGFAGPLLVIVAATALARDRGLVTEPRAVTTIIVTTVALAGATLTQLSWSSGFVAADQGLPPDGLAAAWPWLVVGAWTTGTAAIAIVVDALLRRTRTRRAVSVILSVVAGALVAPAEGLILISPYTVPIAAVLVGIGVVTSRRHVTRPSPPTGNSATERKQVPAQTRSLARLLAITSAIVSGFGVVYALTGSGWGVAQDQTEAMAQGITLALTAALPLIAAIGVVTTARTGAKPAHTWGPLVLVALALAAVAIAYRGAPAWETMVGGFVAGSALGGTAIAWWMALRLPGRAAVRVTIAVLIGVVYAAFIGFFITPMLAFLLPLLAAALAIWTPGRPPRDQHALTATSSVSADPLPRLS